MDNSPHIKPEYSPAESFLSVAGDSYPPLFHDSTMNPLDVMTPQSFDNYDDNSIDGSRDGSMAGTPAPEKKAVKKRKSWGQQLPEPKTNLPPRKRAKTEDEKEQRRVERVLRNRRAAQSSRERKRQEVEALEAEKLLVEQRNEDLMRRLAAAEAKNLELQRQLERVAAGNGAMTVFASSSTTSSPANSEGTRQTPRKQSPTFSQALFGPTSNENQAMGTESLEPQPIPQTVDPASLSPEMRPVEFESNASSTDLTQLPAAELCDLQCQSVEQRPWMTSTPAHASQITAWLMLNLTLISASSSILMPLARIIGSLSTKSPLSPTASILTLIIWLSTTTASLTTHSTSFSTKTISPCPRFTVRISLLRRLLTRNPLLARPLLAATLKALRSASEQQLRHCISPVDASRFGGEDSPGVFSLMTVAWEIQCYLKELDAKLEAPELDAARAVRQDAELDRMLGENMDEVSLMQQAREMKGMAPGQKSRDGLAPGV